MAGTFTIGEKKVRPGTYHRYENRGGPPLAGATNGIGAALFKANWGPLNKAVDLDITSIVSDEFGSALTVDTLTEMFNGGCVTIRAVRIGNGGTQGSIMLKGIDDADAVKITSKYVGDRKFAVTVRDTLVGDNRECIIYESTREFEKVTYEPGGNEAGKLAEAFKKSTNFIVEQETSAEAILADATQLEMSGGENPTTTVEDYSVGLSVVEATKWNLLCVDTSDTGIHALVQAFMQRCYLNGMLPMCCIAETADVELETRMKRAAAYNDEKMHYVLNPVSDTTGTLYDGYKLAARIGGLIAATPANQAITHEVISGFFNIEEKLTNAQIIKALQRGCICLTYSPDDQVWVEQGINTLVTLSADQDEGWKKIRRTKTRFELMDRVAATLDPLIGKVNNDPDGRATVIAAAQGIVTLMAREKKLMQGGLVYEDTSNPPAGDSAWFIIDVDDIDSLEKIYLVYRYRFSPYS